MKPISRIVSSKTLQFIFITAFTACTTAEKIETNVEIVHVKGSELVAQKKDPYATVEQLRRTISKNQKITQIDREFLELSRTMRELFRRQFDSINKKGDQTIEASLIETEKSRANTKLLSILEEYKKINENLPAIRVPNFWIPDGLIDKNIRTSDYSTEALFELIFPKKYSECISAPQKTEKGLCERKIIDRCSLLFSSESESFSPLIVLPNYEIQFASELTIKSATGMTSATTPATVPTGVTLFVEFLEDTCRKAVDEGLKFKHRSAFFHCSTGEYESCNRVQKLKNIEVENGNYQDLQELCLDGFSSDELQKIHSTVSTLPSSWPPIKDISSAFARCTLATERLCKNVRYIGESPAYSYVSRGCKVITATKKDIESVARALESDSNADADSHRLLNVILDTCNNAHQKGFKWSYVNPSVSKNCKTNSISN